MISQNEKNSSALMHLSAFLSFVFPLGSIIGPVIMWTVQKDKSEYLDENGREAINFNLSYTLYVFILGMAMFPFAIGSIFSIFRHVDNFNQFTNHYSFGSLFGFLSVGSIIAMFIFVRFLLTIVAAIKSSRGEVYHYPLTIKFVKESQN